MKARSSSISTKDLTEESKSHFIKAEKMLEEPVIGSLQANAKLDEIAGDYQNIDYTLGLVDYLPVSHLNGSERPIRPGTSGIEQLARSIQEKGLLQPIIVRPKAENHFEVVAGNRRFNACRLLGWRKIPCHIVELDDKDAYEISLIENMQRETMDPLEEAEAYKKYVAEFGWGGISDLAQRIGKSISYISKRISLLELPEDVLAKIKLHEINPSAAEELLRLDDNNMKSELAQLVSSRHLSIKKVRELVTERARDSDGREFTYYQYLPDNKVSDTERPRRAYDKVIISLRIALNNLASIMEDLEDDWIIYEVLMQQKNALHNQIDLLIKEKRRLGSHSFNAIPR